RAPRRELLAQPLQRALHFPLRDVRGHELAGRAEDDQIAEAEAQLPAVAALRLEEPLGRVCANLRRRQTQHRRDLAHRVGHTAIIGGRTQGAGGGFFLPLICALLLRAYLRGSSTVTDMSVMRSGAAGFLRPCFPPTSTGSVGITAMRMSAAPRASAGATASSSL